MLTLIQLREVRYNLSRDDIRGALEFLMKSLGDHSQIIQYSAQYHRIESAFNLGLIDWQTSYFDKDRLVSAILKFIEYIEREGKLGVYTAGPSISFLNQELERNLKEIADLLPLKKEPKTKKYPTYNILTTLILSSFTLLANEKIRQKGEKIFRDLISSKNNLIHMPFRSSWKFTHLIFPEDFYSPPKGYNNKRITEYCPISLPS